MASTTPTAPRPQSNGVLPVTASQTTGNMPKPTASSKPPSPRLKVIVRRLAPALTEAEFAFILGEEWKLGKGKVDWFLYKPGKDSKDPSKPSRPSRAYLHLTNNDHLISLSDMVRQLSFEDAQNTFTSPSLIGPPTVEFAPYGRVPGGRRRTDARAGTIDQDPEFMAFLEELANPAAAAELSESSVAKPEKVTMTPLVQYLKDKKASKSKDAAVKLAKKQDAKGKGKEVVKESPEDPKSKGKEAKVDKLVEKAAKEAVKILNRQPATPKKKPGFDATKAAEEAPIVITPGGKAVRNFDHVPHRQRGAVIAAANRMFKRDISLAQAQSQAAAQATSTGGKENSPQPSEKSPAPTAPKSTAAPSRRSRGKGSSEESKDLTSTDASSVSAANSSSPMLLLKKPTIPQPSSTPAQSPKTTPAAPKPTPAPVARKPPPIEVPSDGATRAFVKHANPSQGVTEPLLKEAMEKFGGVSMVEIDRRKGFAYVDFIEPEGLKKAMAANPTSVAQGTVQVMERKAERASRAPAPNPGPTKKPAFQGPPRGGRGGSVGRRGRGGGGGRGGNAQGSASESPKPAAATPTGPAVK